MNNQTKVKELAARAVGNEFVFWELYKPKNLRKRQFDLKLSDNPYLMSLMNEFGEDKMQNILQNLALSVFSLIFKRGENYEVKSVLLGCDTDSFLVSPCGIMRGDANGQEVNTSDMVHDRIGLFYNDLRLSATTIPFLSETPIFYTCDGANTSSVFLSKLKCCDKANIYMHIVLNGMVRNICICENGVPTPYCTRHQRSLLADNSSYNGSSLPSEETTRKAGFAMRNFKSETQQKSLKAESILRDIKSQVQSIIDNNSGEILVKTASILSGRNIDTVSDAEEYLKSWDTSSAPSELDGSPILLFTNKDMLVINNYADDIFLSYADGGISPTFPFETESYEVNRVLFFVLQRLLIRESVNIELQLVSEAWLHEKENKEE